MPDTKISALAIVGAAADAQDIPVNDAGTTKRITLGMVDSYILRAGHVATASLANNAVDNTKLRDSGACSIIGRATNAAGDPADISAAGNDTVLGRRANVLTFAQVATAEIANDAIDDTKIGLRGLVLRQRQGNNTKTSWGNDGYGTDNIAVSATVLIQVGNYAAEVPAASSGSFVITLPTSYPVSKPPLVFVTPNQPKIHCFVQWTFTMNSQFTVYWETIDASNVTAVGVYWLTIGPET